MRTDITLTDSVSHVSTSVPAAGTPREFISITVQTGPHAGINLRMNRAEALALLHSLDAALDPSSSVMDRFTRPSDFATTTA